MWMCLVVVVGGEKNHITYHMVHINCTECITKSKIKSKIIIHSGIKAHIFIDALSMTVLYLYFPSKFPIELRNKGKLFV